MEASAAPPSGHLTHDIGHLVARHRKLAVGRGPTRMQAVVRHNVVTVIMHDSLTESERLLVAGGDRTMVLRARLRIQELMRDALVADMEALTGCKVEAFMSANHIDPDVTAELFVLDRPLPGETPTA
jgi:uncharacterized protein YbcI